MIVARTVAEARAWRWAVRRTAGRLALVPTMGALHAGHLALVEAARASADAVALSVFVNPTQFAPGEDFARYPRDLPRDITLAEEAGVDLLFAPEEREMYPAGAATTVDIGPLGGVLEGAVRPHFFRGVATVVLKLFAALGPDEAFFGQKDAQQVVVVRRLVRDLLLPTAIRCVPTVREADGLARSSRNAYLSEEERRAAPVLYRALERVWQALAAGERAAAPLEEILRTAVAAEPLARLDYAAVVDAAALQPVARVQGRVLVLVAARLGGTRLLDNLCVRVDDEGGLVRDLP
jgi:pantoate--beta-alanine ligase